MPAPTMSYLICSMALVALIFAMPFFYFYAVDNIQVEMTRRELKEISDYVSDTLENLYFLANSTNYDVSLEKALSLPSVIMDSTYIVNIVNGSGGLAQKIRTYLKDKSSIYADSWLLPGLKVNETNYIESGEKTIVAGCSRVGTDIYVWIKQAQ